MNRESTTSGNLFAQVRKCSTKSESQVCNSKSHKNHCVENIDANININMDFLENIDIEYRIWHIEQGYGVP